MALESLQESLEKKKEWKTSEKCPLIPVSKKRTELPTTSMEETKVDFASQRGKVGVKRCGSKKTDGADYELPADIQEKLQQFFLSKPKRV